MVSYLNYLILVIFVPLSVSYQIYVPPKVEKNDFDTYSNPRIGPKGMSHNKTTSCQTFAKYARFNPHSVLGVHWFVFYYWSPEHTTTIYEFLIPTKNDLKILHHLLDGHLPNHFNWSSTLVIMRNIVTKEATLLEEKSDRGRYLSYHILRDIPKGVITPFKDIRLKQTGGNKYLGLMYCKAQMAFIMSNIHHVPPKHMLHEEAAKLGYRGRGGKSYLYQGHQWMPIPEMEEHEFWVHDNMTHRHNMTKDHMQLDKNMTEDNDNIHDKGMAQDNAIKQDENMRQDKGIKREEQINIAKVTAMTQGKEMVHDKDMPQGENTKPDTNMNKDAVTTQSKEMTYEVKDKSTKQDKNIIQDKNMTQDKYMIQNKDIMHHKDTNRESCKIQNMDMKKEDKTQSKDLKLDSDVTRNEGNKHAENIKYDIEIKQDKYML